MAQEDVFVAASSSDGETEDVREECASLSVGPNFLTPMQSLSSCSVHSGSEAATTSASSGPSSSALFSARIQSLSELRNAFLSDVEFEIESSKSTSTETSVATSDFDDEEQRVADRVAFEKLKEDPEWGPFFQRQPYELEIGGKIAEGGQAEIFEALGTIGYEHDGGLKRERRLVVKVFKKGFSLEALQKWWPPGLASAKLLHRYFYRTRSIHALGGGLCLSVGAQLLDDGRFAFIFDRLWGDFRKLIDGRMLKSNGAAPFPEWETYNILTNIAQGMLMLHECGLLHRDLKAANVLALSENGVDGVFIADFESSVGSSGTRFWRAPEVLSALKDRSLKPETFTQQSDVYSYAMTCYEVLTGRVPFEGHRTNDYDMVLGGERPDLPVGIGPFLEELVRKCWHQEPSQRPSFRQILELFGEKGMSPWSTSIS